MVPSKETMIHYNYARSMACLGRQLVQEKCWHLASIYFNKARQAWHMVKWE